MIIRVYYVAVNDYRDHTSNGFVNTWTVYRCLNRADQARILEIGLPVKHCLNHEPTTNGIRTITREERTRIQSDFHRFGVLPDLISYGTPC